APFGPGQSRSRGRSTQRRESAHQRLLSCISSSPGGRLGSIQRLAINRRDEFGRFFVAEFTRKSVTDSLSLAGSDRITAAVPHENCLTAHYTRVQGSLRS